MDGFTLHKMLKAGWKIEPCSCSCGGSFAWLKPRESGSLEMFGCVCHCMEKAVESFTCEQIADRVRGIK
jgi:hypothetical protein